MVVAEDVPMKTHDDVENAWRGNLFDQTVDTFYRSSKQTRKRFQFMACAVLVPIK